MHRCSIEVGDVNYASLCDYRGIQTFLSSVARAIGAKEKAKPHLWELAVKEPPEHTLFGMLALAPRGSIVMEASPHEGWFTLDVCSVNPVEKKRILSVVEKEFCEKDSVGQKVAKSHIVKQGTTRQ